MNFEIPKLNFPNYETLKKLNKNQEYKFTLFRLGFSGIYGRLSLYEDFSNLIYFDVLVNGYINDDFYVKCLKFNKKNYENICNHAQKCYNEIFLTLYNSPNETIKKYFLSED